MLGSNIVGDDLIDTADTGGGGPPGGDGGGSGGGDDTAGVDDPSKIGPRPADPDYSSGKTVRHGIQFDTILHATEDLGWDPDGNETIDIPNDAHTLVEIPNGTYQVGRNPFSDLQNWGLVGIGENVTFRPPEGVCTRVLQLSSIDRSENVLVENIEFDQRDDMETGIGLILNVMDGLEVHNCQRTGRTPNRNTAGGPLSAEPWGMVPTVGDPDGQANICHWTDHSETVVIDYPGNGASVFAGASSAGTIRMEDCSIRNQGEHAMYMSKAHGVEARYSEFVNNVNTNMRIAGRNSNAEYCIIGFDRDASYTEHHDWKSGKKATKMLRSEDERFGSSGGYYDNCLFYSESPGLVGSYILFFMGSVGGQTVKNCTIRNDVDDDGAVIQGIGEGWRHKVPPDEKWIRFENSRFEGSGSFPPIVSHRRGLVHAENCVCDMPNAPKAVGLATHDIDYIS